MKNMKKMFFVLTLLTLVLAVTTVSAADNDTTDIVSQAPTVVEDASTDVVSTEQVQSSSDDKNVNTDKIIEKKDKNVKKDPVTIDGVEYDNIYENQNINDEYLINPENQNTSVNNCTAKTNDEDTVRLLNNGNIYYINNLKINVTNLLLLNVNPNGTMIINNTELNSNVYLYNQGEIYFYNSTLNGEFDNQNKIYIDEKSKIGDSLQYRTEGEIIYIGNSGVYEGNNTIENQIITNDITNKGNLTIINSTLNSKITNNGILIINDDVIFGENFILEGDGQIIINDTSKILPYVTKLNGNYTIENQTFNKGFKFYGNITLINCLFNEEGYVKLYNNYGILYLKNCTINISNSINNYNIMVIDADTQIISGKIQGDGTIFYGDIPEGYFDQPTEYHGENTQENMNLVRPFTNNGNLTLLNCTISTKITNQGNITLRNSNISELITNNGNISFINCSFSNNNMNVESLSSIEYAFLLDNKGTARLENCVIENNTFNTTANVYSNYYNYFHGAILNNGTMTVVDTVACNNSLGYCIITEPGGIPYGNAVGRGTVLSNFGTLTVDNSTFTSNYAGDSGAAIFNAGDLTVDNSVFEDNLANLQGSAIATTFTWSEDHTVKSTVINNSLFKNNTVYLSIYGNEPYGGAIYAKQSNVNIHNCTFDNNQAYTSVEGIMGVGVESSALLFEGNYYSNGATSTVDNCTFINHDFTVIANGKTYYQGVNGTINNCIFENNKGGITDHANLNITNNIFKNTTNTSRIIYDYIEYYGQQKTITDNQFIDNNLTTDTIYNFTSGNYDPSEPIDRVIENNIYSNTTINDTIDLVVPSKIYTGEPITITGTYTINNPENYDSDILEQNKFNVYINGNLDQTVDTLEFTITPTAGSMIVTVQPTISQSRKTTSIRATTLTNITITHENYNEYIYEGSLIGVGKDTKITFNGQFTDKGEIYIDTSDIIIDGTDATFTNTKFTLDAENIVIQNMNINNTNLNYPIANYKDNNIIANNTITLNNPNSNATAIYNGASNTIIANNTLTVTALAGSIDFSVWGVADTQAILLLGGDKNTVQNNNINIKSTQATGYNTLEAITNSNGATNTLITQNNITISDANFNYAIDCLSNVENITITENTILVTGERYCDGIQVGNSANNIIIDNNNITCTCINSTPLTEEGAITYGVIATSMGSAESNNITITNNNIDITGTVNYAIELYKVNNTEIHDNNITVTGPYSLGIGYSYAPNGSATGNTITITGDSTTPINYITEEIKPENTGIRIQNGTQNVYLEDNTITTKDIGGKDTTINTDEATVTIKNNKLTSSQGYGDETVKTFKPGVTFENNVIETTITTEDVTTLTNTPTTLTATVTTETGANVNGGTVTFTDTEGNTIATATVNNGTATTTITFKEAITTTITATYNPTSTGLTTSTTTAQLDVQEPVTNLTIEYTTPIAGQNVTLTAKLTDQLGNNINGGKVVFKINGKTIKDTNGKVIYAKVVNGTATVTYNIPSTYADKNITIEAVYSGTNKYNSARTQTNTTIQKTTPTFTTEDVTATIGETITLKATITDGNKIINTGKVVFKINGKTVKDANGKVIYAKITNGIATVNYTIPTSYKAKNYTLTATLISNEYDRQTDEKTLTITA